MASTPGILTDWPWKPLGSFKYMVLAPWAIHSTYSFLFGEESTDLFYVLILHFCCGGYSTTRFGSHYLGTKLPKAKQQSSTTRASNLNKDDQVIFNGLLLYVGRIVASFVLPREKIDFPVWRVDGFVMMMLLHTGPVEYLYYWLHRALHHHFLYSRYHSHHHSSIVTEPITSVTHPFAEHISYFMLFAIPMLTILVTETASITSYFAYITYIDFMNNMGHCNFEFIPNWIFTIFPPLKYLIYTPSYHSLHHTQFRTNYCLFMPIYDYIYGTMDKSSDALHGTSLRKEESPDVVHLTHLTTTESIYQLPVGFAALASKPHTSRWYLRLMWPVTLWSMILTRLFGPSFAIERQNFDKLRLQSWVIPKYRLQYLLSRQSKDINSSIEESILEAEKKGVKVISLGLLNQGDELNSYGGMYVQRNPQLKVRVVDGNSLATAVILNSIPKGTTQVLLTGKLTKVAYALAFSLRQRNIEVATLYKTEYLKLAKSPTDAKGKLVHDSSCAQKIWLVGDDLSKKEQLSAPKGTIFVPFTPFPPKELRKDCYYHCTPAMKIPESLQNVYSCENWLPRRVMSVWRIAGIVHALEGWNEHECGYTVSNIDKVWQATFDMAFNFSNRLTLPLKPKINEARLRSIKQYL